MDQTPRSSREAQAEAQAEERAQEGPELAAKPPLAEPSRNGAGLPGQAGEAGPAPPPEAPLTSPPEPLLTSPPEASPAFAAAAPHEPAHPPVPEHPLSVTPPEPLPTPALEPPALAPAPAPASTFTSPDAAEAPRPAATEPAVADDMDPTNAGHAVAPVLPPLTEPLPPTEAGAESGWEGPEAEASSADIVGQPLPADASLEREDKAAPVMVAEVDDAVSADADEEPDGGPNWMLALVCVWAGVTSLHEAPGVWGAPATLNGVQLSRMDRVYGTVGFTTLGIGLLVFGIEAFFWGRRRRGPVLLFLMVAAALLTLLGVVCLLLSKYSGGRI